MSAAINWRLRPGLPAEMHHVFVPAGEVHADEAFVPENRIDHARIIDGANGGSPVLNPGNYRHAIAQDAQVFVGDVLRDVRALVEIWLEGDLDVREKHKRDNNLRNRRCDHKYAITLKSIDSATSDLV
jgi:hypothetical protein